MTMRNILRRFFFVFVTILIGITVDAGIQRLPDRDLGHDNQQKEKDFRLRQKAQSDPPATSGGMRVKVMSRHGRPSPPDDPEVIIKHNGKRYMINFEEMTVRELTPKEAFEQILEELPHLNQVTKQADDVDGELSVKHLRFQIWGARF